MRQLHITCQHISLVAADLQTLHRCIFEFIFAHLGDLIVEVDLDLSEDLVVNVSKPFSSSLLLVPRMTFWLSIICARETIVAFIKKQQKGSLSYTSH